MRKAKIVGFYQETHPFLVRGPRDLPSFETDVSDSARENEERIIAYLNQGHEHDYVGSRPVLKKPSDRTSLNRSGLNLTDGVWIWPSELAYYLREYHLRLPDEFVDHMKANSWAVPAPCDCDSLMFPGAVPGDVDPATVPVREPSTEDSEKASR